MIFFTNIKWNMILFTKMKCNMIMFTKLKGNNANAEFPHDDCASFQILFDECVFTFSGGMDRGLLYVTKRYILRENCDVTCTHCNLLVLKRMCLK